MKYNRTKTTPVPVQRTQRVHDVRVLTSLPAGKMVPLAAIPLLREDSVTRSRFRLSFEMMETVEVLMNAVNVNVKAYLVSNLCFERFNGMDDLNRSYEGIPVKEGDPVIDYFETMDAPAHGANEILLHMGKHARVGTTINASYIEAYNAIWNFRARNRSLDIAPRDRLAGTLAPAFWQHSAFAHIVPDFDQAVIDGEVSLNVTGSAFTPQANVIYNPDSAASGRFLRTTDGGAFGPVGPNADLGTTSSGQLYNHADPLSAVYDPNGDLKADLSTLIAEMGASGITVSLSNLEAARRTQAFAKLRAQYHGHTDDFIIDLLMDGITVPEQSWRQPILLAERMTQFGMSKRYASDAANLTASVVNGGASVDLSFGVPRVPMGGVVMLVAEITPDQLFERQKDPYLYATSVAQLPQFLRDTLDPEKVSVVTNDYVDLDHDTPNATFGYAPLNHEWTLQPPQIGGRFYRPEVDAAFDEDRQRIWAVETQNPVLSEDFYLCTTMHTKPFVVTNQDPFEGVVRGQAVIQGNTVFGGILVEANDDYAKIEAQVPQDRIVKPS